MSQHAQWVAYSGTARIALALVLLVGAGGLAYAATRFRRPVPLPRPGRALTIVMLLAWVLAIGAFVAALAVIVLQALHDHVTGAPPADPVTNLTGTLVVVLFVVVFIATPHGMWVRLSSAVIAAIAAPWIFEVPFDLIVMTRTDPGNLPDPGVYQALFFAPIVLVGLTTLSLLSMTPVVKLTRPAFYCLALMLLVFAVWALAGFGYPSAPVPIAMNMVSKVLAFAATLGLFFPEWFTRWWRRPRPAGANEQPAQPSQHAASAVRETV